MTAPTGDPEGYAIAFEEGKKAIADQSATLKETRDRVGTIVSAAAVAASLGAALAFNSDRIERLTLWGALGAVLAALGFGLIVVSAVMIWRPTRLTLTLDPGVIVGSYVDGDPPASVPEIHRELALHLGSHVQHNRDELSERLDWFLAALWGFLLEIGGLMLVVLDVAA